MAMADRRIAGATAGRWEHFNHGADIGVRGVGPDLATAFEQAATALTAVVCDPATVTPAISVSVECVAADEEFLLVDWLDALIYEMATRKLLFGRFRVHIVGGRLQGEATDEPIDVARHRPAVEIKGATLTGLRVARDPGGDWVAECVVDV